MVDDVGIKRTKCFLESLLDSSADCHYLTGRLHCSGECSVCGLELVKRPACNFDHHVVNGRLKACRSCTGDGVCDLVKVHTDCDLCGNTGDRVTGCFGCKGRRPGYTRVDFNDPVISVSEGKLNVASSLHVECTDDLDCSPAHNAELVCSQGKDRCDHNGLTGVYSHRVNVFHTADDDTGISCIPHDLELNLVPAFDRLFD